MKTKYILLVLVIILLGCKDEFILKSDTYEQVMVVDGLISNEPGPYTIYLSLTAPVNSDEHIPLEGYIITLHDNTGQSEILSEVKPGKYVTSESGIQGVVGNEYSISIINPSGVEYKSDFQKLPEPVEIESVYTEIDSTISRNYAFKIPGYQFYVDSKLAQTQENYFLWSMTESYEYDSDYEFYALESNMGLFMYNKPKITRLRTCWKTQKVNYIFTGTTTNLSTPQIRHQPLHFVSTDTKKLSKRYSLLMTQYIIGEEEYKYWKELENILSEENAFSTSQPYSITGNIKNINNPKEKVYGYFTVASVSQKRIYVDYSDLDMYYIKCTVVSDIKDINNYKKILGPPYYWVDDGSGLGIVAFDCIDCTSEGGTTFRPIFWVDE